MRIKADGRSGWLALVKYFLIKENDRAFVPGVLSTAVLLPPIFSEFVFVIVIVQIFFFNDIQFDRVETYYFELDPTFLTGNTFAFIRICIHMDVSFTLRTCSSRHFFTSKPI
jgi:hypothetical protein